MGQKTIRLTVRIQERLAAEARRRVSAAARSSLSCLEFWLAVLTAAVVVLLSIEHGVLLAVAVSLLLHVRHSYRPHSRLLAPDEAGNWLRLPAQPGAETAPGLVVYRFDAALFYANETRFADEVRRLLWRPHRIR
jgi:MFS superfamily sulfate permease-like transporter